VACVRVCVERAACDGHVRSVRRGALCVRRGTCRAERAVAAVSVVVSGTRVGGEA